MLNKLMDIHNHTNWSDGIHTAEEIIENAINNRIEIIGISDHFDTIKCNSVPIDKLKQYIQRMKKLKDKYKDLIKVVVGIEICMKKSWCDLGSLPYAELNKLDYVLFEYIDLYPDSVTLEEIKEYTSKITCEKCLAHTDILNLKAKYGYERLIKSLKENDLFWELNVNSSYEYFDEIMNNRKKGYVDELFNRLKEDGIKISVGSDTHSLCFYDLNRLIIGNVLAQYNTINK